MELSVKFASQICHENINKSLDGAYLEDFGIDIKTGHQITDESFLKQSLLHNAEHGGEYRILVLTGWPHGRAINLSLKH